MSIQIGSLTLRRGLLLAPMAGVTDGPYRAICRRMGAEYTLTEMISAKAVFHKDHKTLALSAITPQETPCAIQLFGCEPDILAYAAAALTEHAAKTGCMPAAFDINMGCPVPKIVKNGEGSALLRTPLLAGKCIEAVRRATPLPVTVKLRTGFTEESENIEQMVRIAIDSGACLLVIHGRTRSQMYRPGVNLDAIRRGVLAARGQAAVVGNGDLFCADDALFMLHKTGCDGVMLARGTQGNPFLFAQLCAALDGVPYTPPTPRARLALAQEQIEAMVQAHGEHAAVLRSRKLLCWYSAGMPGAAAVRRHINQAQTLQQCKDLLQTLAQMQKE